MRSEWVPEDLIACWTLVDADWPLIGARVGASKLGFSLMLKYYQNEAKFPRSVADFPAVAVGYVAAQVKADAGLLAEYGWAGRSIGYHRAQIREACGFRESSVADEANWVRWLSREVCPVEFDADRQFYR